MYKENIFTKIIKGEIPCNKIYETPFTLSFYDINPQKPCHILVISKGFYIDFLDFLNNASSEEQLDYKNHINKIINKLESFQIINNKGKDFQEIFHFHTHILSNVLFK